MSVCDISKSVMRFWGRRKKRSNNEDGNETQQKKIEMGKKDALKEKATASQREREGKEKERKLRAAAWLNSL